jgi:propanol-preferring alcohol dehydrogenase
MFGLGGLGFNALQIVRHIGARVIVCDIRQSRLDAARELGVPEEDIIPLGKSPVEFVREKGLQIDKTLDFAGTHQTWEWAQEISKLICYDRLTLG